MATFQIIMSLLPFLLIGLGYTVGRWREQSHLKSLAIREEALGHIVVTNLKTVANPETAASGFLVMGEAVIATDYFKSIAAQLRNLIGGEMKSMQSLVDRARREATVQMLEQADRAGAREVHNVRLETSNIRSATSQKKAAISVEMLAFGTAIVRR